MSEKDTVAKNFLSDNRRFADLCNYYLFGGNQVIQPENLQEQDTTELISKLDSAEKIFGIADKELNVQKWRNILKRAVIKKGYSVDQTADMPEESIDTIQRIYDIAASMEPVHSDIGSFFFIIFYEVAFYSHC